ncbi:pilus assembly protein N-terminal domain-containing protein [Candidatus Liberibacter sp.]|uniref:pilus assembly protein N-terminal domain-containing protein n=1 Tax=Candidatus Liberibacter sp. TaxID=34022 RepID=UPI0015F6F4AF|nr:pilus assembly protein N-terminal domain-containing protein [Candidatus Liberibacter sp.]MBA5723925.1 pilus assembly protein N-terminal domain-containing protein [Candidatus Liberibacter sp.]
MKIDPVISRPIQNKNQATTEILKSVNPVQKKSRPPEEVNVSQEALPIGHISGNISGKPPEKNETIRIENGESRIFRFDAPPITAILGNPKIISATSTNDGQLIVTGKNLGSTNLVVLGKNKTTLLDVLIVIFQSTTNIIQVQSPDGQKSFYCNPKCIEFQPNKVWE